jgi:hypothetical protein
VRRKAMMFCVALAALSVCLDGCSTCYKARSFRKKAAKSSGAERHRLEGQAASLEAACLKGRDDKYDQKMQKQFEDMENKARN